MGGDQYAARRPAGVQFRSADRAWLPYSYRINYAGDSVWIRIARGCLKKPKYIRVQAHSEQTRISPTDEITEYLDSPMSDGANNLNQIFDTWTPWVVTG